ncbi:MAG TPA: hypothetical protein PLF32_00560 [Bacteroidales bacterium]|nr:hypothetical protein [Bacteroidales bacterium]HON20667.1 hypothetical protein [Bacteroidales bacterium]HOR81131.1 hypothetical protein [Bacteroidales bacterium]HPJ90747.1 hypothetical protein [Bacteroidales bacterium]HQB19169.1 hypothetical protein [Bacteroidales bacterium]
MLTQRKKLNLIYLSIGFLIGIIFSVIIDYFGVIKYFTKRFTKSNTNKIEYVLAVNEKDSVERKPIALKIGKKEIVETKDTLSQTEDVISEVNAADIDSTFLLETEQTEQIRQDRRIMSTVLPVINIETDSTRITESNFGEIYVEQWENPTNFTGYKKTKNTLIIYGINLDEIEIQSIDNVLYLVFRDKKLALKESNDFIRFPATFLAK